MKQNFVSYESKMISVSVSDAVAIDNFLATESSQQAMGDLYDSMATRYKIELLGRARRYLGWHFHYNNNGSGTK